MRIVTSCHAPESAEKPSHFETWRMDADGSGRSLLPVPGTDVVVDWSPDGRWLLMKSYPSIGDKQLRIMHPDSTGLRSLAEGEEYYLDPRFSPDGRSVVFSTNAQEGSGLWIVSVDGKSRRQISVEPKRYARACWSPDGKWLAIGLLDKHVSGDGRLVFHLDLMSSRIEVLSVEGEDRRRLDLPKGLVTLCDWR